MANKKRRKPPPPPPARPHVGGDAAGGWGPAEEPLTSALIAELAARGMGTEASLQELASLGLRYHRGRNSFTGPTELSVDGGPWVAVDDDDLDNLVDDLLKR